MLIPIISFIATFTTITVSVQGSTLPNNGQKVDVDKYRLQTTADYVPSFGLPRKNGSSPTEFNGVNYVTTATLFVQTIMPNATFRLVGDHYIGVNGIGHVYFKQSANGLDIDNADFNVNVSSTSPSHLKATNTRFLFFSGCKERLHILVRKLVLRWRNPISYFSRDSSR
jgi:hypothetical protein